MTALSSLKRIQKAFDGALRLPFDGSSRVVLMSDCHRGDGDGADNFAKNHNLYSVALDRYDREGFTYIEMGDGDELWESRNFAPIADSNGQVFKRLMKLYSERRLYFLYGNHDIVKKSERWVEENLHFYRDSRQGRLLPLFPGLRVHESIVLSVPGGGDILLLHGHQADFFNCELWRLSRFLVRWLWRPLQMVGLSDPTSPALNAGKKRSVEQSLIKWCEKNKTILIAGHTHRSMFPEPGEVPYFNDGCCVHARHITAIELENGMITLVKWSVEADENGGLFVRRGVVVGPRPLIEYFPVRDKQSVHFAGDQ